MSKELTTLAKAIQLFQKRYDLTLNAWKEAQEGNSKEAIWINKSKTAVLKGVLNDLKSMLPEERANYEKMYGVGLHEHDDYSDIQSKETFDSLFTQSVSKEVQP